MVGAPIWKGGRGNWGGSLCGDDVVDVVVVVDGGVVVGLEVSLDDERNCFFVSKAILSVENALDLHSNCTPNTRVSLLLLRRREKREKY